MEKGKIVALYALECMYSVHCTALYCNVHCTPYIHYSVHASGLGRACPILLRSSVEIVRSSGYLDTSVFVSY